MKGGSAVAFGSHGRSALGVGAVRVGAAQGQGLWSFGSSHWGHVGTTRWGPKCHGRGAKAMVGLQVGRKVFLHARTWACPTAALPSHGWAVPMLLSISVSSHLRWNLPMAAAVLSESNLRPCRQGGDGACDNPSHPSLCGATLFAKLMRVNRRNCSN